MALVGQATDVQTLEPRASRSRIYTPCPAFEISINHPQLARSRVNRDEQRARQTRGGDNRLPRSEAGQSLPQSVIDAADRAFQPADDVQVGDLVQDVVID